MTSWRSLLGLIAVVGCASSPESEEGDTVGDPVGPIVNGTITVNPGGATARYTVIAIRLVATDPIAVEFTNDRDLPVSWPYEFTASGGFDHCPDVATNWELRTWLAVGYHETAPTAGAPHAEVTLAIERCPSDRGLAIELRP